MIETLTPHITKILIAFFIGLIFAETIFQIKKKDKR
jgi:hypothetical protein